MLRAGSLITNSTTSGPSFSCGAAAIFAQTRKVTGSATCFQHALVYAQRVASKPQAGRRERNVTVCVCGRWKP